MNSSLERNLMEIRNRIAVAEAEEQTPTALIATAVTSAARNNIFAAFPVIQEFPILISEDLL